MSDKYDINLADIMRLKKVLDAQPLPSGPKMIWYQGVLYSDMQPVARPTPKDQESKGA